jgi:hypothetical protein
MTDEQLPLFPEPPRTGLPRPRGVPRDNGTVTYTSYRWTVPRFCDDCVAEVRAKGWTKAPRIQHARWRRQAGPPPQKVLCTAHKQAREITESKQ